MPHRPPPPGAIEILPAAAAVNDSPLAPSPKKGTSPPALRIFPWLLASGIILCAAWAFISIRPVSVTTAPEANNLHLEGGWAWRSNDTWYLTAGSWTASGKLTGYEDLQEPFLVSRTGVNSFKFDFVPLPGYLTVAAVDEKTDEPLANATAMVNGKPHTADLPIAIGAATVQVQHPDYLPSQETTMIHGLGQSQELIVRLKPRRGILAISNVPTTCTVRDGETNLGPAPGQWELEPGRRTIHVDCPEKQPWSTTIEIKSGEKTIIDNIELIPTPATVKFASEPPGAQISLDEALAGVAPFRRILSPGVYAGRAVLPGYKPADLLIDLKPGEETTKTFTLTPLTGKLTINAPKDSKILIDGTEWTKPMPAELPVGLRQIEVRMPGHPPVVRPIVIRTDREATLSFALPPQKKPPTQPAPAPPQTNTPPPYGILTVPVQPPATPFTIGSPRSEPNRRSNEAQRNVQLSRAFEVSKTEITNEQFLKFDPSHKSGTGLDAANHPVVSVTWDQAARFCNHLNERQNLPKTYKEKNGKMTPIHPIPSGWRLPTESEWELCARQAAPQDARFPWGRTTNPKNPVANLADESTTGKRRLEGYKDNFSKTAPVKSFPADQLGLFDLAGNASEWCHDYYSLSTPNPNRIETDPTGPNSGIHHIIRGSNYTHYTAERLRIAFRDYSNSSRNDVGFRICRFKTRKSQ